MNLIGCGRRLSLRVLGCNHRSSLDGMNETRRSLIRCIRRPGRVTISRPPRKEEGVTTTTTCLGRGVDTRTEQLTQTGLWSNNKTARTHPLRPRRAATCCHHPPIVFSAQLENHRPNKSSTLSRFLNYTGIYTDWHITLN
jgi:hypothetical protein